MSNERTYSTKEVAKRLHVEPVTVRKYAQIFEAKGYSYQKDSRGWRQYTDEDITALEYYLTFRFSNNFSVDEAIEHVATLYSKNFSVLPSDTTIQDEEPSLKEFMNTQMEFNQKVLERLDQQEQRQAERDQKLMLTLNQSLETQKQLAAAKEKKWWQFWK